MTRQEVSSSRVAGGLTKLLAEHGVVPSLVVKVDGVGD